MAKKAAVKPAAGAKPAKDVKAAKPAKKTPKPAPATKMAVNAVESPFQFHEIEDQIVINYHYSMGGQSPFFIALKNDKKLMGTKCPNCGTVYVPPRVTCARCYKPATWVQVKDTATIKVATLVWYSTSKFIASVPYAIGYIQLDGATTSMLQGVFSDNLVPSKIKAGKRVRAVFKKEREGKATDFFFVPEDEYADWVKKPGFEGGA